MKLSIPKDYDIRYVENNKCILFIITLLFFVSCGIRFNAFPYINYLFYFLAVPVLFYIVILTKRVKLSIPIIIGIITISYFWYSQLHISNYEFAQIFTKTATISYFILGSMLLAKCSKQQVFYICDLMLITNLIFHILDFIYRLVILKFNIIRLFTNIYSSKFLTFIHLDTNFTGFLSLILIFLSYYLYTISKSKKYIFYSISFCIFTFLSMSRSAWIAIGITFSCIFVYKTVAYLISKVKSIKLQKFPLRYLILFITLMIILWLVFNIAIFIQQKLTTDASFGTKLRIYDCTINFLYHATKHDILFGSGFNLGRIYTGGIHTHTFLSTFLIESGLCGISLMLFLFLSILLRVPRTLILLLPFFAASVSFSYLSPLFYSSLAIVCYFEELKRRSFLCH